MAKRPLWQRLFHLKLLTRLVLALVLVGIVPLAVIMTDRKFVEDSLRLQVLQTHSLVARGTAGEVAAFVAQHRILAQALANNPIVYGSPNSTAAEELLAGVLQAQPTLAAVSLSNLDGEEFVRAQTLEDAQRVERTLKSVLDQELGVFPESTGPWLRLDVAFADGSGVVRVVLSMETLQDVLKPYEIDQQVDLENLEEVGANADLVLTNLQGEVILGSRNSLEGLPASLVEQALSGWVAGVTGEDAEVLGAYCPVAGTPWVILSTQPREVAEAVALRMRRRSRLALGGALTLTGLLTLLAYRSVIRPIRKLVRSQRRLVGLSSRPSTGDEIEQLQESFSRLERRIEDQKAIGEIFLGRYQVIEVVGEGGMGTVFRGWDPKLKRPVALKTVRLARDATPDQRKKQVTTLLHEAVAAARVNHPNVVAVYDVLDSQDVAFLSMELVEGITLADYLLDRDRVPHSSLISLALAVARGLGAAHKQGVVHHDVKPANILLGWNGEIKVVDFGIARFLSSLHETKKTVFGTPGYLPPEALRGKTYTEAGDLFSLGAVLYECLAGSRPFSGLSVRQLVLSTLRQEPDPLRQLQPEIPEDLERLVIDLLKKDPLERISSTQELIERLEAMPRTPWTLEGFNRKDEPTIRDFPTSRLCPVVSGDHLARSA